MALRPDRPTSRSVQPAGQAAPQGDAFLREVDDALREDQVYGAIRKYGKPVGAAIIAGLIALAGWLWYDNHVQTIAGEQGEALTKALDQLDARNFKAATDEIAPLAKDGNAGYATSARLLEAAMLAEQGKAQEAAKIFARVAADDNAPQPMRDLATVREVALTFGTIGPDKVIARLKPLAVPGNPWFGSAGELVGIAYLQQGKNELAGALFGSIAKDKDMPDSMARRARQMAGLLGVDAVEDPDKAALRAPVQ